MDARSNVAATRRGARLTLADGRLDGYNGDVDIISLVPRRWWHRLGIKRGVTRQRLFVDVRSGTARAWRRG